MTSLDQPACGHVWWGRSASQSTASKMLPLLWLDVRSRDNTVYAWDVLYAQWSRLLLPQWKGNKNYHVHFSLGSHNAASKCKIETDTSIVEVRNQLSKPETAFHTNCRRQYNVSATTDKNLWNSSGSSLFTHFLWLFNTVWLYILFTLLSSFLARDVIYTYRAYATMSVSVCLSVCALVHYS